MLVTHKRPAEPIRSQQNLIRDRLNKQAIMNKWIYPISALALALMAVSVGAQNSLTAVADARQGRLKVNDNQAQSKCGTLKDVAGKVDECARTLVQILEGTLPKWPQQPNDMIPICAEFEKSEKCIREVGRQCLTGLKRTIVSTFASALTRSRKRECTPNTYLATLKGVQCVEKNTRLTNTIMHNASDFLTVINDQMSDLDLKTKHVCCMLDEVENNIKRGLGPKCPADVGVLTRMYRTALEDVSNLICRAPKCLDLFKGYKVRPAKRNESVVSLLIQILFSIS